MSHSGIGSDSNEGIRHIPIAGVYQMQIGAQFISAQVPKYVILVRIKLLDVGLTPCSNHNTAFSNKDRSIRFEILKTFIYFEEPNITEAWFICLNTHFDVIWNLNFTHTRVSWKVRGLTKIVSENVTKWVIVYNDPPCGHHTHTHTHFYWY